MLTCENKNFIEKFGNEYEKQLLESYENLEKEKDTYFSVDEEYSNIEKRLNSIENEFENLDSFNDDIFFEMANFYKEISGLPFNIWIDDAGKSRMKKDKIPRIKVQDPNDSSNFISVSISKQPEILAGKFKKKTNLKELFKFISLSYDDLMAVWNGNMYSFEFILKYKNKTF